jgi:hypothetical protein
VFGVTVRLMSDGEISRLEVLRDMDQRRLTTEAAPQLLGLERRQVFGLLKAYRSEGSTGLISKRRGRPSNRRKPEELRDKALAIIREQYWDFGPTLAPRSCARGMGSRSAARRCGCGWSRPGFGLTASSAESTSTSREREAEHERANSDRVHPDYSIIIEW